MFVNIFQIVVPRIADPWLANLESQLASCVQLPAQREGLQVGQTPVSAVQQDLGDAQVPSQDLGVRVQERGAVRDVPEPVHEVQVQRRRAVDGVRDLCQGYAHLPREGVVQMEQETLSFLART